MATTKKATAQKAAASDQAIEEFLTRGVDTIYPTRAALAQRLRIGKPLTLYLGVDPSGADIHLGHLVALQKLRQAQALGHRAVLLMGDFTGQTGDPTDKQAVRVPLSKQQVRRNARHYQSQVARILRFDGPNPVEVRYNTAWLEKLSFAEVAELANHFTVQQMLERDMFANRLQVGKPISLREFLYPLMQGYDSVAMKVDLEIGGTDQTFNMLAGRKLAKDYLGKEKAVLTVRLLADGSGVKIGKTAGNAIAISSAPEELYGQVMTLPDEVIRDALEWCTSLPLAEVRTVARSAADNPRDAKMKLAYAIVAECQGAMAAQRGEAHFKQVFQDKRLPADLPKKALDWKPATADYALWEIISRLFEVSTSEARRKIQEGAVRIEGQQFRDPDAVIAAKKGSVLQLGKKRFVRLG